MAIKIINFPDGYSSATTPPTNTLLTVLDLGNTVCPLDITNKVDSVYLPSYVDDVLEYADLASFPGTGTTGKIYIALDTNLTYRWSGSAYVEISSSKVLSVNGYIGVVTLAKADIGLGSVPNVDATNPANISQTASYRFVTDSEKSTWSGKENSITSGTTSQYWRGDKTFQTLDKAAVGLGNVVNLDTSNPANISQTSSYRFVTDAEKATWNSSAIYSATYSALVTWATTATNGALGFSTDTKILYYSVDGILQEIDVMRTISGTITQVQKTVGLTAVRATVSGSAPSATRKRLKFKPSKNNTGNIYYGSSSVTTATGLEIIGPDGIVLDWDASDYYLISDVAAQVVEIIEVV